MKVLVIDDNPDILKLVKTVLVSEDHEFTGCDNGEDGIKKIKEEKFDLVFLDLNMPGVSGLDVINRLAEDGIINNQKIVLFTASTISNTDIAELIEKGVHSYLAKPVDIDTLLELLDKIKSEI